jgi:hypothetical protein
MKRVAGLVFAVVMVALFVAGCSKKSEQGAQGKAALGTGTGSVAGVKWTVPKRWTSQPERPMRIATYGIPAAEGDAEGGECAVSFFGSGQGGNVDANIERWVGQFENASAPSKGSKEVNGMKVTTVGISGAYLAPSGPMMQSAGTKANFRLLGAIADAPEGMVFFKFTGPAKTVAAAEGEFDAMVGSLSK